jgi:hypothetical protein
MVTRAMSIPRRELKIHLCDPFTFIITGTRANRAPHISQLSLAPPNDRVNLKHTLLPYVYYFHLRWLRDVIPRSSPRFLIRARLCPARRSHNQELYNSLSASTMSISTASTPIATAIMPARYTNVRAHWHRKTTALATAYAAPAQAALYHGQKRALACLRYSICVRSSVTGTST